MTENKFLNYLSKQNKINPAILTSIIGEKSSLDAILWDGKDKEFSVCSKKSEKGEYLSYHRIQDYFKDVKKFQEYEIIFFLSDAFEEFVNYFGIKLNEECIYSYENEEYEFDCCFVGEPNEESTPLLLNVRRDSYIPNILGIDENKKYYFRKGLYFIKTGIIVEDDENEEIKELYVKMLLKAR